jgi:uncharacterized Fe-S cluster-containing radical SAM superfamily protein
MSSRTLTTALQGQSRFVAAVSLQVTRRCNLRCNHCYLSCGPSDHRELPTSLCLDLVKQLSDLAVPCLAITGGEPLMHSGFIEIVQLAADLGMRVKVNSNGTLWPNVADELNPSDLFEVRVSVDGDEVTHDTRRGSGTFGAVNDALHWLHKRGFCYTVAGTMEHEQPFLWQRIQLALQGLSPQCIHIYQLVPEGRAFSLPNRQPRSSYSPAPMPLLSPLALHDACKPRNPMVLQITAERQVFISPSSGSRRVHAQPGEYVGILDNAEDLKSIWSAWCLHSNYCGTCPALGSLSCPVLHDFCDSDWVVAPGPDSNWGGIA